MLPHKVWERHLSRRAARRRCAGRNGERVHLLEYASGAIALQKPLPELFINRRLIALLARRNDPQQFIWQHCNHLFRAIESAGYRTYLSSFSIYPIQKGTHMFSSGIVVQYLFVDGAALTAYLADLSKQFCNDAPLEIDFKNSVAISRFKKIFFYDAVPAREDGELEEAYLKRRAKQDRLFERLRSTDRVHVYEGDARRRGQKGGQRQKMVDVMLAVDMLTHSFRRNMHEATLFTGDLDFKPLIDALVMEGMFVTLWYPRNKTNAKLIAAADERRPMKLCELESLLTLESRERFPFPSIKYDPPPVLGSHHFEWINNRGQRCGIYSDGNDWIIECFAANGTREHIRSPHWDLCACALSRKGLIYRKSAKV
jgi:uncharacterized LabA/DUF88 family protein